MSRRNPARDLSRDAAEGPPLNDYQKFIAGKLKLPAPEGIPNPGPVSDRCSPLQRDCVRWALQRGRAALFLDTGLGKTLCELAWAEAVARHTGKPVLILAPLAVTGQTVREGEKFGYLVKYARSRVDQAPHGTTITNYDILSHFDPSDFGGVALDESSILKSLDGATKTSLCEAFAATPFRLACTATPAPNDWTELGQHAEFLGVMRAQEMLSRWFVHEGEHTKDWRLKGHAEADFWKWVCSWGAVIKMPSDIGHSDDGYVLPPLEIRKHVVAGDLDVARANGLLFSMPVATLTEHRAARRASMSKRVALAREIVSAESAEPWIIWCELNDEADAMQEALPGSVQIAGSDDRDDKERNLLGFAAGSFQVLISKSRIAGLGMNYQHCARQVFVGAGFSFEAFYQSIRRSWRFGQARPVVVHLITSEAEVATVETLVAKQAKVDAMSTAMRAQLGGYVREGMNKIDRYVDSYDATTKMVRPTW